MKKIEKGMKEEMDSLRSENERLQKTLRTSTKELSTSNKAVERMESIQKDNTTSKAELF